MKTVRKFSQQEQKQIDQLVQKIRPKIFEPWIVHPDQHFHFLLRDQQQFCARTLTVVHTLYKEQEPSIHQHVYLIIKVFRFLQHKTKSNIDPFHSCLVAIMHDVGKSLVSKKVFGLPRKLTPTEEKIKQRHSLFGEAVCQRLGDPFHRIAPIVRSHHEDWSGTGFPDGLKGREIPLAARLLRLADVMSALRVNRHYRKAYSKHQTLKIMRDAQEKEQIFEPALMQYLDDLIELT